MRVKQRISKKMCENLACPAVLRAADGDILIIGEDVTSEEIANFDGLNEDCAENKKIVKVPREVWDSMMR